MKKSLAFLFALMLTACFWGEEPHAEYRLGDDLWLVWWGDESSAQLVYAWDEKAEFVGGTPLVPSTVFAAAFNDDFVLLKRHPNRIEEIQERLWGTHDEHGWKIADLRDTVYFSHRSEGDSIFRRGDEWYHTVGGWTPPDSLRNPYRRVTSYYLLDLRAARADTVFRGDALLHHLREYPSEEAFREACRERGVPDTLRFTVKIDRME